jgi:hypothetical protein
MRPIRAVALALGLFTASTAAAGEVPWSYKVVDFDPPAPVLAQGSHLIATDLVLMTLDRPTLPEPNLPDPTTYRWDNWSHHALDMAHIRITDEESGQSAWRRLAWGVYQDWEKSTDRKSWVLAREFELPWPADALPSEPYLGGNTYRIWVDEDRQVHVRVLEDTLPTHFEPEPGTLALAGIGIGAVGLVRRVRRGRPS